VDPLKFGRQVCVIGFSAYSFNCLLSEVYQVFYMVYLNSR